MRFTLEIESDDAALSEEGRGHELARIVSTCLDRIRDAAEAGEADSGILRDYNGNPAGRWELEEIKAEEEEEEDPEEEEKEDPEQDAREFRAFCEQATDSQLVEIYKCERNARRWGNAGIALTIGRARGIHGNMT